MTSDTSVSDRTLAVVVAGLPFVVYLLGACPTMYVGDSGELTTAVGLLGIPHPSGYPLYVLLGKLWTMALPVGSMAWRMSLFSSAAGALAVAGLFLLCRYAGVGRPAAAFGALLFAFSPSFWSQANIPRVYALNALFVVAALAAVQAWLRERRDSRLAFAFLVCGLGACNHGSMAVVAAGVAMFALVVEPDRLRAPFVLLRRAGLFLGAFAAGLLPYAYLPLRSRMDPRLDWGNPETLDGFLTVVLRRNFWERAWYEGPADLLPIVLDYARSLGTETAGVGAVLAVIALAGARRRDHLAVFGLFVLGGNLLAMAFHGSRTDLFVWHRYYIPSYLVVAMLAAFGWDRIAASVGAQSRSTAPSPSAEAGSKGEVDGVPEQDRHRLRAVPGARAWLVLVVPAFLLAGGYRHFDRSRYAIAEDFSLAVLESLPPGAHLAATDDNVLFVLMYLHLLEGRRPDIDLVLQGVGGMTLPPLRFDADNDPLFFTHHPNWDSPEIEIVPRGIVYQAWPRGRPRPDPVLPRTRLAGEEDPRVPKDYLTQNLIGHFHYTMGFTFERRDWIRARASFDRAAAAAPANDVLFYNLGLVFHRNGLLDEAITAFGRSARINPRHLASPSRPRAADKLALVRAEKASLEEVEARLRDANPGLPARGSAAYHRTVADLLAAGGHERGARGHFLRAVELEGGAS